MPAFHPPGIINYKSPGLPTAGKGTSLRIRFGGQREAYGTVAKETAPQHWPMGAESNHGGDAADSERSLSEWIESPLGE